jgi:alkyl hydroperoxide reductase subunit F
MAIENYISVLETDGPKFATALEAQVRHYDVDIMNLQRADKIVPATEAGGWVQVHLANGGVLKSRSVILSTGARWRNVNVPGEQEYKNKGVAYCPHCDGPLFKGKRVAVIGGGNSGVEAAIDLAGVVAHVTLVEFADALKADAVLVSKLKSLPNVTIHVNATKSERPALQRPRNRSRNFGGAGRCVRANWFGAQHRVFEGHLRAQQVWRNRDRRQMPHQLARRVCRR